MERAQYNRHSRARMAEMAKDGARHATPCNAGRAGAYRPSEALHPRRSSDVLPRIARERVPTVPTLRKRVEMCHAGSRGSASLPSRWEEICTASLMLTRMGSRRTEKQPTGRARRVALKMGRLLRCSPVTYRSIRRAVACSRQAIRRKWANTRETGRVRKRVECPEQAQRVEWPRYASSSRLADDPFWTQRNPRDLGECTSRYVIRVLSNLL